MDLFVYLNFRSPYGYLASTHLFDLLDAYDVTLKWRPFGGWDGRSNPERAKKKVPLVRQDVGRWARRMEIPFTPPPVTTDPTRAGAASLYAEEQGRLRDFVVRVFQAEWGEGRDIGDADVLREVALACGLDADALLQAADDPARQKLLLDNWRTADEQGVFGVPTFIIGDQIFWGQDRMGFLAAHLDQLGLRRPGRSYRAPGQNW